MADNPFEIASFMKPFDYAGQRKESQDYLGSYANAIRGQEALPAMYSRLSEQYGIPQQKELVQGLGQQMTGLNQRLYELPGVVSGTTRNSLVTQGQRANLIESKSAPMRADLAALGSIYGPAASALASSQGEVSNMMGLTQQQQAKDLMPFERGFSIMEQQQAREFSGYTFENQQELNRLIANANNGLQWTNAEADRANQLAMAEMGYKNELNKMAQQNTYNLEQTKFGTDEAIRQSLALRQGSGGAEATSSAINTMMSSTGGDKAKMWQWIHTWEPEFSKQGVDASRLWALYNNS
jgi:hypothetical protein